MMIHGLTKNADKSKYIVWDADEFGDCQFINIPKNKKSRLPSFFSRMQIQDPGWFWYQFSGYDAYTKAEDRK